MTPTAADIESASQSTTKVVSPYDDALRFVYNNGKHKGDRTGTGTISHFGYQMRFDLNDGFPLVTTKFVPLRVIAEELFWFLDGGRNIRPLLQKNVHIWSEWPFKKYLEATGQPIPVVNSPEWKALLKEFEQRIVDEEEFAEQYGDLGPVYGVQWREWQTAQGVAIDQITKVIEELNSNPNSRRMLVSAWNVPELPNMALEPCHAFFQLYVVDGTLSCQMYQRSADMFLGVPFNIASYALLTMMIAQQTGLKLGEFIWVGGDCHIYDNHVKQVEVQLKREPYPSPTVRITGRPESIFDYQYSDFVLEDYQRHPKLEGDVAV